MRKFVFITVIINDYEENFSLELDKLLLTKKKMKLTIWLGFFQLVLIIFLLNARLSNVL